MNNQYNKSKISQKSLFLDEIDATTSVFAERGAVRATSVLRLAVGQPYDNPKSHDNPLIGHYHR